MSLQRTDVERLLQPEYLDDLADAPPEEIRKRKSECKELEELVSFLRRIVQGQIDLVCSEQEFRSGGERRDTSGLVEELPAILAASPSSGLMRGESQATASPVNMSALSAALSQAPDEASELGADEIARLVMPDLPIGMLAGANLADLGDAELEMAATQLREHEQALSAKRRLLFERIDQLQAALVQCYKSGAASSDSLLASIDS